MKQFLTVIQDRKFQFTLAFSLSIIWFIGPYIAIAGKSFVSSYSQRTLASILAFATIGLIEYLRAVKVNPVDEMIPPEVMQELQTIRKAILTVLRTLYKGTIGSILFRYKKPWYLVLGPTNAGKSTLLNKANLNVKGLDNLPPMMIETTKSFDWWLADEAVFVDIGGRYLSDNKENFNHVDVLFRGFFRLLKRFRAFKPVNGLILMVNLQDLTVNTKEQTQLKKLRTIIHDLLSEFMNVPIYLLITRSDVIEGFNEYFEDLGPEERNQIFGMSFPLTKTSSQSLPQLFDEQFNRLLTRLNERVIKRLHQEHNLDKIAKIKNFPLQMEFLKNPLAKLLNLILPNTHLNLRGVFFTSVLQKDTPFDNLTKTVSHAFNISNIRNAHRSTPSKSFFINEIFQRIIFPETKFYASHNADSRLQLLASLVVIGLTGLCIYFFISSYKFNRSALHATHHVITLAKQQPENAEPLLQQLNLLQVMMQQLKGQSTPWYSKVGLHQVGNLHSRAEEVYQRLLATQFLSYLQNSLEEALTDVKQEKTKQLYASLKAYLMLGDPNQFDKAFFASWFDNYWHQSGQAVQEQQQLNYHINALISRPLKPLHLNNQLIANTRATLNNMPQSRLVLTILENHYQRSSIKLLPDLNSNLFSSIPREIPGIFDISNFRHVYYTDITKACQEINQGDWVLGKMPQPAFSNIMLNQLAAEVKAIYLNEYAATWLDILTKIRVDNLQSLSQVNDMIELLNTPHSPLSQLITTIKNNTQPLSDSIEFTQQVSPRFLILNTLTNDVLKHTNQATLVDVKNYLGKIITSSDIELASFDAAKLRMTNPNGADALTNLLQQSRLLPEPLQTWHASIAAEAWRILLKNTENYLNRIWTASVYPQYETLLNQRYPLFKESTTEIALTDFTNFFGINGVMDTFFKNYLEAFIDNSRLYWEWKNVDGQKLAIPQTTLEMFIRAALIQKMFFSENATNPTVTFSLVPAEFDPKLTSFSLNLEGQMVTYQKDNEQILSLTWPGPQPNHTQLTFIDDKGKRSDVIETGTWSWFRLLDKCQLESTNNPKHFKLSFDLNGYMAHYELYTNGIVNPYLPGILSAFRCPPSL